MDKRIEYAFVEMDKLEKALKDKGIEYERIINETPMPCTFSEKEIPTWNQILIERDGIKLCSAVCHYGSYGSSMGLIECYDFGTEPIGSLDHSDALAFIIHCLERNCYGRK